MHATPHSIAHRSRSQTWNFLKCHMSGINKLNCFNWQLNSKSYCSENLFTACCPRIIDLKGKVMDYQKVFMKGRAQVQRSTGLVYVMLHVLIEYEVLWLKTLTFDTHSAFYLFVLKWQRNRYLFIYFWYMKDDQLVEISSYSELQLFIFVELFGYVT